MVVDIRVNPLLHTKRTEMKRTKSRSNRSGKGSKGEPTAKKRSIAADRTALKWADEDIQSSDSEDDSRNAPGKDDDEESDEDGDETAEQRRKRFL